MSQTVCLTIWADSDNGSTVALQASGRGSIPRRSTKHAGVAQW